MVVKIYPKFTIGELSLNFTDEFTDGGYMAGTRLMCTDIQ